jgi:hypothetical protein
LASQSDQAVFYRGIFGCEGGVFGKAAALTVIRPDYCKNGEGGIPGDGKPAGDGKANGIAQVDIRGGKSPAGDPGSGPGRPPDVNIAGGVNLYGELNRERDGRARRCHRGQRRGGATKANGAARRIQFPGRSLAPPFNRRLPE